jgi:hypothetical protein
MVCQRGRVWREGGVLWPAAIPTAQQPTPPASARWRPACRWESIARLAKSGSLLRFAHPCGAACRLAVSASLRLVALRPACAPWLRVLVPRRPVDEPSASRLAHPFGAACRQSISPGRHPARFPGPRSVRLVRSRLLCRRSLLCSLLRGGLAAVCLRCAPAVVRSANSGSFLALCPMFCAAPVCFSESQARWGSEHAFPLTAKYLPELHR